jgi:glycosyltransferase involved in cell wall biosynthesis
VGGPVVLVAPIVPAKGGNGLAMRAGMVLEALADRCEVDLVVVAVSGAVAETDWAAGLARSLTLLSPVGGAAARPYLTRQLADPLLRERLAATAPLPARAAAVPPTLAADAIARMPAAARGARAVFVLRGYLAPFGCMLARALAAARIVIDLDDDDEAFARSSGLSDEADAIGRLGRAWLPEADVVCTAAQAEAAAVAERYGLRSVRALPNAVRLPARVAPPPPGAGRLLFVGNLTYAPNLEAAVVLAREILPVVRENHPHATVDLVGAHAGLGGEASAEHVRVAGAVAELEPWYEGADVVVAPLLRGGGTRIKVLEAFANRRAVVATPAAVAGLEVRDGREVLLGDSPRELARHVTALLDDPRRGAVLVVAAARTLAARYTQEVVAPAVWELVAPAATERPR